MIFYSVICRGLAAALGSAKDISEANHEQELNFTRIKQEISSH